MKTLAERLKWAMKERGLTQETLAARCGLSQTAIHKIETGKTRATRAGPAIAAALNVDLAWLLTGAGEGGSCGGGVPGDSRHADLLGLFDALPEFAQDELLSQLRERVEFYRKVYREMDGKARKRRR